MAEELKKICAWCHPKVKGKNITHGICRDCKEKMENSEWSWNPNENKFEKKSVEEMAKLAGKSLAY